MANNTEQEKKEPVTVENAAVQEKKPSKPILLWIAILILLILGAGLYWLIEQQKIAMTAMAEEVKASQQAFDGRLSQIDTTVSSSSTITTQLLENLNSADVGLAEKLTEVVKIQDMTNDDVKRVWAMSEVEFLLQTASQRVLLAGDSEGAKTALILADEKLKVLADPRLYRLRALLADEQLALSSVTKVDIDGLALRLQSVLDKVETLQVLMAPDVAARAAKEEVATTEAAVDWKGALMAAWHEVRSLVVIRHQKGGAAAVLVPEKRYFLYQNLHLKLETARLALLEGREAVYHDSLTSAEKWLTQYFVGEERDAVLATLTALNSEKITVAMPDISASLAWLKEKGDQ
jgi:uroporphyrin-III C-methyltransferase